MKKLLLLTTVAMLAAVPAKAATVGPGGTAQGITYDISVSGGALNSTSATFLLHISGINDATDLEGGRSAVNDFAIGGINDLNGLAAQAPLGHSKPVALTRPAATEPETSSASTDQRRILLRHCRPTRRWIFPSR